MHAGESVSNFLAVDVGGEAVLTTSHQDVQVTVIYWSKGHHPHWLYTKEDSEAAQRWSENKKAGYQWPY